jgi:hypothetical protein
MWISIVNIDFFFLPFYSVVGEGDVVHFLLLSNLCFNNKNMCDFHLFVFFGLFFGAMAIICFHCVFFFLVVVLEICV